MCVSCNETRQDAKSTKDYEEEFPRKIMSIFKPKRVECKNHLHNMSLTSLDCEFAIRASIC